MSALTAGRMSYIGEEETGPSGDISEEKMSYIFRRPHITRFVNAVAAEMQLSEYA